MVGRTKTWMRLLPRQSGKHFPSRPITTALCKVSKMIFSYTQIASYLRCPRSYRYRYLDGWREKETRAAMAFGRCFEKALAAYFAILRSHTKRERRGIG